MKRYHESYENEDVEIAPPTRRWTMLFAFVLLLVSLGTWLTYWLSSNLQTTPSSEVVVSISAPAEVRIAEATTLVIQVQNKSAQNATDLILDINYPEGFKFISSSDVFTGPRNNSWMLPTLAPREQRQVTVQGLFLGNVPVTRTTFVTLTYHFVNFRSALQSIASANIKLTPASFTLTWTGPERVTTPTTNVTYQLTYTNNGNTDLPNSVLALQFSPNFIVSNIVPPAKNASVYQWDIPVLSPAASGTIVVTGEWTASAAANENISATIVTKADNGLTYTVAEQSLGVVVDPFASLPRKFNDPFPLAP